MDFDELSKRVIGCAIEVHQDLGPGLLESTYEQCVAHELTLARIGFQIQPQLPVEYKGLRLDCGSRIDLLVDNSLIVELKKILTHMKLAKIGVGLLINFNVTRLKDGLKRFVL